MPWENLFIIPALGNLSRVVGVFVGVSWLITVLSTGRIRKIAPFHIFTLLFLLWNMASIFWSISPSNTLRISLTHFQMAILVLLLWDIYTTPERIRSGLQAYVLGLSLPIMSTISAFISSAGTDYVQYGRYSASGSNANTTGIILAMGFPLTLYLATPGGKSKITQMFSFVNFALVPAIIFAIILTATRFAVIMSVPSFIFGLGGLGRLKPAMRILVSVLFITVYLMLGSKIPTASFQRLSTIDDEIQSGDLNDRTELWERAIAIWFESPILGIGSNAFGESMVSHYGRERAAHNSFIAILAELGVLGLGLFGIILIIVVSQAWHHPTKWDAWFWLTVFITWGLGNLALTWFYSKPTWLLLSLLVASANLPRQHDTFRPHEGSMNGYTTNLVRH